MNALLSGVGILVTRPAGQSARLAQLIRDDGGEPVLFPALAIEPLADAVPPPDPGAFDLVVFVSPNAVRLGLPQLRLRNGPSAQARLAAIGPATAAELKKSGLRNIIAPPSGNDSEALILELSKAPPARVLIVRGRGGRELLGDTLRANGASVEYFECYRRVRPDADMRELLAGSMRDRIKACVATSSNIVDNLFEMAGATETPWLRGLPLFVSHPRIAATAFSRGVRAVFVSGNGDDALAAGLKTWFARPRPSFQDALDSGRQKK
ncbi:MAG TPA: uroporphyrinogen-III synthase [Burkholderiales bacterium]|nr:uroporphyrinogen-III synthase [Burkholderiales bacterium]